MHDEIDWSLTTFEGVRLRHMRAFQALCLREKILQIEEMNELAERFRTQSPAVQATPIGPVDGGGPVHRGSAPDA